MKMTINTNYESSSDDDFDFDTDEISNETDNDIAEFELHSSPTEAKQSKHNNKRIFLAKKKIEESQFGRKLKKYGADDDGDWN